MSTTAWTPPPGARVYRLERNALAAHARGTFATKEAAENAVPRFFVLGEKWRIVKRLNKSGTRTEVVAEGVR